jgi:MSHA pilin protein MshD
MCTDWSSRRSREIGFTLFEIIFLIVILAIAFAGITLVYMTTLRGSADPQVRKQSTAIAESLMDEILAKPFNNPPGGFSGAATQANRPNFDDVSDYNTFATTGIFAIDGSAITGLGSYNVAVAVTTSALGAVPAADSLLVTVTVTAPLAGFSFALDGYKLNCGVGC